MCSDRSRNELTEMSLDRAIVTVLRGTYKNLEILDTSFPALDFYWLAPTVHAYYTPPQDAAAGEVEFYQQFRQLGGNAPLLEEAGVARFAPRHPDAELVIATRSLSNIGLVEPLINETPFEAVLACGTEDEHPDTLPLTDYGFKELIHISVTRLGMSKRYTLLSRQSFDESFYESLLSSLQLIAVDIRARKQKRRPEDLLVTRWAINVDLPSVIDVPPVLIQTARNFIHDGQFRSEHSNDYSWLWTGPSGDLRLLLGVIPQGFSSIRVVFPKAWDTSLFAQATLFLNGDLLPGKHSLMGEEGGILTLQLPQDYAGSQCLAVSFPARGKPDESGRLLIACVDKIELHQ